jgi:hypothetical protein
MVDLVFVSCCTRYTKFPSHDTSAPETIRTCQDKFTALQRQMLLQSLKGTLLHSQPGFLTELEIQRAFFLPKLPKCIGLVTLL